jgi:hypothetical protein
VVMTGTGGAVVTMGTGAFVVGIGKDAHTVHPKLDAVPLVSCPYWLIVMLPSIVQVGDGAPEPRVKNSCWLALSSDD